MALSDNLQFLRARRGLTQEQLAEQLDVTRQSVSKWESSASYPEMETLLKLCDMFGTDLDTLLRGSVEQSCAEDCAGYDKFMNRFSRRIAGAVASILAGIALICLLDARGLPDNFSAAVLLLIIMAAVVTLVASGIQHSNFTARNPVVADFYTKAQRDAFNQRFVWYIAAPVGAILAACALLALFADSIPKERQEYLGTVFFVILAPAVYFLVYGGIQKSKYDISKYNSAHSPEDEIRSRICGIIMLIATAVFLVMALNTVLQPVCWAPFPVGGILCGIVALWRKDKRKSNGNKTIDG